MLNSDRPRRLNPAKLPLSKWTAVAPVRREKHFIVTRLLEAEPPAVRPEWVELEAVHSGRSRVLPWRELLDAERWLQGWK
jgi:tryptophan-rich hypothetical protein